MLFDDETDELWDEMAVARRLYSRKDKMDLVNDCLKVLICEELSNGGFEDEQLCNLHGLRDALMVYGFVVSLVLGADEPILTIRKQGRKRKRWIDRC